MAARSICMCCAHKHGAAFWVPHAKQGRMVAGAAGISAYCASKFAVRGFLDSLRLEARQRYFTNCCPMPFLSSPLLCLSAACVNIRMIPDAL